VDAGFVSEKPSVTDALLKNTIGNTLCISMNFSNGTAVSIFGREKMRVKRKTQIKGKYYRKRAASETMNESGR
jgi:hypothetical protein